ncbi:hypothetical protein CLOM_g24437 [Closterium sp. NIES-68]|nr:hypothetical protein CLOM_g24437 [Closterium sp. NIES-68]GJP58100.1 hypothetical protein CLOP_g20460 [Closterium sp. NIES-67]
MAGRPEQLAPPEVFYNDAEARKYTTSSRMIEIQAKLTERAVELLALPDDGTPRLLLDIGCGSGLSGEALSEAGHHWVGLDISPAMLDVAAERAVDGDLMLSDMGQGLPVRNAVFDGAISISAVQWLCNADKSSHNPRLRLKAFFQSLYRSLARGGRAALQIYPNGAPQLEMISKAAMQAGFSGGLVVDYPHSTRAKKYFLCLVAGPAGSRPMPKAKEGDGESEESEDGEGSDESDGGGTVGYEQRQRQRPGKKQRLNTKGAKGRNWVLKKKEHRRQRGDMDVPRDTKYTARKRKSRF